MLTSSQPPQVLPLAVVYLDQTGSLNQQKAVGFQGEGPSGPQDGSQRWLGIPKIQDNKD